jgi:hypothetical protein
MTGDRQRILWVPVPFSEAEYLRLASDRDLTADGLVYAAVRSRMGMNAEHPVRFTNPEIPHLLVTEGDVPYQMERLEQFP